MAKAISNKNVLGAKFDTVEFEGAYLASFGKPQLCGSWFVWSGSFCGKTSFVLRLCKYLAGFDKTVVYDSLEEGLSPTLQRAWLREGLAEAGSRISMLHKEELPELKKRLRKRKSPDVVVLDSLVCMVGFSRKDYLALMNEFPKKLFIFLCHEKNRRPDPPIGDLIWRLSDVKIHIEGYVAQVATRYMDVEKGEGGADFVIWEKGAVQHRAKVAEAI